MNSEAAAARPAGDDLVSAARRVTAAAVRSMLDDGGELAILDVREELIFSRSHLLLARSAPLSRLELRVPQLVPRRATRIVLVDDGDGLAARAAAIFWSSAASRRRGGMRGWPSG